MPREWLSLGIDVGSTTAKVVVLSLTDGRTAVEASAYIRHDARVDDSARALLAETTGGRDDCAFVAVTGSAGMGLAERFALPFVQEVRALCALAAHRHPDARTLLDIGGEDAKLVFLGPGAHVDARMNSGCAGGTGAFLDQMAALLAVDIDGLDTLAESGEHLHPVASRCGVFAKTDVQGLLSGGASRADVALSVFHATAIQVLAALARGRTPETPILVTGGPLTFLPALRRALASALRVEPGALVRPERGALACAEGAALAAAGTGRPMSLAELRARLVGGTASRRPAGSLTPLFEDDSSRAGWTARRFTPVPRVAPGEADGDLFLGVDSGSTTTKLVLIDRQGRLVADAYEMNRGDPLDACRRGFDALRQAFVNGATPTVRSASATGYGEGLVRAAFHIDRGVVETEAHLRAARALASGVSFVLDIGGQDMKALFVRRGALDRIDVNEACSSGCGTFLQTFAEGLSLTPEQLADAACRSRAPRDLGSRCTVFMNSMVKQALREGAALEDIAAGLCYSVARNCLQKVLKLRDFGALGDVMVVQGGTFLNPAVHRAFEVLTGRRVVCPDRAGLAGAWGAALHALDAHGASNVEARPLASFVRPQVRRQRSVRCHGCDNHCPVTLVDFDPPGRHVAGNRCERVFHGGNASGATSAGVNHTAAVLDLLLRPQTAATTRPAGQRIGLPLALGMYENLPFWESLLTQLGHEVVVSGLTDRSMVEEASQCFCSDSVCLPARVASGHLLRLAAQHLDRILFPMVVFEAGDGQIARRFNCPIVTGYPEVVASTAPAHVRCRIATPAVSFADRTTLRVTARRALEEAGIEATGFDGAFVEAWKDYEVFQRRRRELGVQAVDGARANGRRVALLACRPYHLDPFLNHGVPQMLSGLGYDVVCAQWLTHDERGDADGRVLGQWAYPRRVLQAADWAARQSDVQFVQLNSFGCGPDAIVADEAAARLAAGGKAHTLLRIDESTAPGSIRLRLRTLGACAAKPGDGGFASLASTPPFLARDRHRTIITAPFGPLLSIALGPDFARLGYRFEVAPDTDRESLELGLRHVNNEICYPAILTIGDILKGLRAFNGSRSDVAVGMTQTGGPCRASNYVPVLKKAMVSAGFGDVPVIGLRIGVADALNDQPGFTVNRGRLLTLGLQTIVVTDAVGMMARSLAVRERHPGESARLAERLVREWSVAKDRGFEATLDFVDYACRTMSAVRVVRDRAPRVGIVGEIYVKLSRFANHEIADWLIARGIEPVVPPLASFFAQEPINAIVNRAAGLDRRRVVPTLARVVDAGLSRFFSGLNRRLERFGYPVHFPVPGELAATASRILSLTHQYGEGWVLGGEIADMADHGITKVVCLQPFGCIANQVVARGIESRLRAAYPTLDLLYVDLDHNTSAANLFNRLELLIAPPLDAREPAAV